MDAATPPLKNVIWQIVAAFIAHTMSIQAGINMAYSTVLLPQIMSVEEDLGKGSNFNFTNETELIVDKAEASWIASLVTIATPVGSLLTGLLVDRFGRKSITAFTAIPFITSWILVAMTSSSVYTIYVARIFAGIGGGLSTSVLVYVSEISHPSIRPMLLSLTSVFVSFGILLTLLLSYFFNWKVVAICCGVAALLSLISTLFIPESPAWIVGVHTADEELDKGFKKAERNLMWFYKSPQDYQREFEALVKIKEQKMAKKKETLFKRSDIGNRITLTSPQAWKPLFLLFILFILQQLTGSYIVIFYAVQILEKSGSVEIDNFTSVLILGLIRFVMAIISTFWSRKFGRRPLLISSGACMALSILAAGAWVQFMDRGILPVVCLLLFVLFASYGVTVIPWTLISELLPLDVRGKGSGFIVAMAYVFMFITVKIFLSLMDIIGISWIFFSFSAFSAIFTLVVYFKLPETFGKTFQEIAKYFQ